MITELLITLGLGFLAALLLTPVVRAVAIRFGIVDHPDNHRKLHSLVVARAGGTSILISSLLVLGVAGAMHFDWDMVTARQLLPYIGLLLGMLVIWSIGLADDIRNLRGRQKLLGQIVVSGILVYSGFCAETVAVMGFHIKLGWMSIPLTVVWLLACTNAMNLIDGADGLCSTVGAIIFGALGTLAAMNGHFAEAAIAFAFCGSLLGFLVFNFPPASIFLGDSGSLLIGMVAGALSIRCSLKGPAAVTFLVPLCILFLPLLDSTMAIVRRKLTGRSIYTTDRAHIHHLLRKRGFGDKKLLMVVGLIGIFNAVVAILGLHLVGDWVGVLGAVFVFGVLVKTRAFGYTEMVLLVRRTIHFVMSFLQRAKADDDSSSMRAIQLQGSREWDKVWETMVEFAERELLCELKMDLHVPWLEEGFHGSWHRNKMPDRQKRWSVSLPIFAGERIAGFVHLCGVAERQTMLSSLNRLTELIEDVGPQIEYVMHPSVPVQASAQSERETVGASVSTESNNSADRSGASIDVVSVAN
jgi:UDP-GlcNAc:undecaprenyl-phosphate/decaprenyl-phosphate GlcNAc-1-phosphate transferase